MFKFQYSFCFDKLHFEHYVYVISVVTRIQQVLWPFERGVTINL